MLTLRRIELDAIYRQARLEYPAECCGILTVGPEGEASSVHPCPNIQDELHAQDPDQYPRDSRIAYFIDPGELFRIVRRAEETGGRVSGFYHSHVDCDAYFSEEDKERAMVWDEPAYPDAVYLVVSVGGDGVRGHEAFAWEHAAADFVEVEIAVVE